MRRRPAGPRRSGSVQSYLRQTRLTALLALLALAAGVVSDVASGGFWTRHPLLASLAASVIVVLLSVAVVNEVVERRRRQRWTILAQYVLFELVRNARMIWTGVLAVAGLWTEGPSAPDLEAAALLLRDVPSLTSALRDAMEDDDRRAGLHAEVAFLSDHADDVLGRWAAIMLNSDLYAEVVDRHVELAGDVAWIGGLLDTTHPPEDHRRRRRAQGNPAVQIERDPSADWLADRIVVIAQLAERLDRGTLELALRIVPVQWWQARLGTTAPGDSRRAGPT